MDELLPVPSAAAATEISAARVQAEATVRLMKMANDASAAQASELLRLLGIGGNLDLQA